jgi:hypothetical protein
MGNSSQAIDKASYRNKGGMFQRLISRYKARSGLTKCGEGVVIKRSIEFRIASGGLFDVWGGRCRTRPFSN